MSRKWRRRGDQNYNASFHSNARFVLMTKAIVSSPVNEKEEEEEEDKEVEEESKDEEEEEEEEG